MSYCIDVEIKNHISGRRYISRYYSNSIINSSDIYDRIIYDIKSEVKSLIVSTDMTHYTVEFSNELNCVEIFKDKKQWGLLHTGAVIIYDIDKCLCPRNIKS